MEVSALKYSGARGLHGRSPLLRLQSDERLVALVRRGNDGAFEVLVGRYSSRLQAFCRHMLGSREDAEDVLQDVMAAAYNAMLADDRPINVRPWLYRIARNRSLNHLRRSQAVGMDSMDIHFHDHGASTADRVNQREEFRLLVGDIQRLPETQRTALVLREMDALSYDQIAEAMETTVPSVKSLLVRARIGLAEASESRLLSCAEVRIELGEVAEGLTRKPSSLVRRHIKTCARCTSFEVHLKETTKTLAVLMPIGPVFLLHKLLLAHIGHSAGSGATAAGAGGATATGAGAAATGAGAGAAATATGAGAAGAGAVATATGATAAGAGAAATGAAATGAGAAVAGAGITVAGGGGAGGLITAGVGALAGKAAAGIAAAALVTAGAVEVGHAGQPRASAGTPAVHALAAATPPAHPARAAADPAALKPLKRAASSKRATDKAKRSHDAAARTTTTTAATTPTTTTPTTSTPAKTTPDGTTTTTTVTTVLPASGSSGTDSGSRSGDSGTSTTSTSTTTTSTTTGETSTTGDAYSGGAGLPAGS